MAHADNVQALAVRLGIPLPLTHKHTKIKALCFSKPAGNNELRELPLFEGERLDPAACLYLQHLVEQQGLDDMVFFSEQTRCAMAQYFEELWNYDWVSDEESILFALWVSRSARITWK